MSDTPYAGRFQDVISEETSAARASSRRRSSRGARGGRSRLRMVYFGIAALWGYTVGAAAILGGVALGGASFRPDPATLGMLAVAGVLALVGSAIAAKAYRETVGRRGR